jgi:hypothetical protein
MSDRKVGTHVSVPDEAFVAALDASSHALDNPPADPARAALEAAAPLIVAANWPTRIPDAVAHMAWDELLYPRTSADRPMTPGFERAIAWIKSSPRSSTTRDSSQRLQLPGHPGHTQLPGPVAPEGRPNLRLGECSVRGPAARPCGSCPYRRDVPSGVWHPDEYAKLPRFDADTPHQPPGVFLCHQQDGRICAGWAGCHDMQQSLGLRIACATGALSGDEMDAVLDFVSPVPLFGSGAEAAAHGLAELESPGAPARRVMEKVTRRKARCDVDVSTRLV